MPEVLDYFCDDAGATGAGVREVDGPVGELDDGGGDGGEGSGMRFYEVGGGGRVAECVGCVGDAEV